jgi:hypothetical protein
MSHTIQTERTAAVAHHEAAMADPTPGFERAVRNLVCGLVEYQAAYADRYDSDMAETFYGEDWLAAVDHVRLLLSHTKGRLRGGRLEEMLDAACERGGFNKGEGEG